MYVINGRIKARTSIEEVAKKLEAGMSPIVQRTHGFRGHYLVRTGERTGEGVLVFDSAEDFAAAQPDVISWYETNISPMLEGEGDVTQGEVIMSVEADGMPTGTGAQTGAEARPH